MLLSLRFGNHSQFNIPYIYYIYFIQTDLEHSSIKKIKPYYLTFYQTHILISPVKMVKQNHPHLSTYKQQETKQTV